MELRAEVELDSGKHSIYTHFPKDPTCDICLKTKMTGFLQKTCWYSRAKSGTFFGDLITADQKILSEESESRNNHRYAVGVQGLATLWQSYPSKTKNFTGDPENLMKFWSRRGNQKSFTLTIPWNLAKPVKIFPGIIVRQHHTDQKQRGLPKEQCAE